VATWDAWFPDVLVHAPAAPDPLVRQAICRSAREFMRRTRVWTEWLQPVATTAGQGVSYTLALPPDSQPVRLERMTAGGRPADIANAWVEPADWTQWPEGPRTLISSDLATYVLRGDWAAGEEVQVQVSLMPTLGALGIPDPLAERHLEAIAAGAKSILLAMPDFLAPELAAAYRMQFDQAIAAASIDRFRGHTSQIPRASVKWF